MGWLRDHGILNVEPEGAFDDAPPAPDDFLAKEAAWWGQWRQEKDKLLVDRYHLAQQVTQEILARDQAPRRRGRPSYLPSYAEYKRVALANWLSFISRSATNLSQEQLARELGFENKENAANGADLARLLRFVKNGTKGKAGGQNRMPAKRLAEVELAVWKHRWHRRGCINFLWPLRSPASQDQFERWALSVAGITLEEYRRSCEDQERATWE